MKATEAIQGPLTVGEQVAHEMLDAAGEQARHARRASEDFAQLLEDLLPVAVIPVGDLLQLVDEQHQRPAIAIRDRLKQTQRTEQRSMRVASDQAWVQRELDRLAELGSRFHRQGQRGPFEDDLATSADAFDQASQRPSVR